MTRRREKWLVFIHHLPPTPSYLRVKVRRRLAGLGAAQIKPSVYALPASEDGREDLYWLRREIVAEGGEAIICEAALLDGLDDAGVRDLFRKQTAASYRQIVTSAETSSLAKLRNAYEGARALDYFDAPGRSDAARAAGITVEEAEREMNSVVEKADPASQKTRWVTRRGIKVDRIACSWLISRFLDADAQFHFVDADDYCALAGDRQFDMYEGTYTHEGDMCTFEVMCARHGLEDGGMRTLREIVHDIDMKDEKFRRAETSGVAAAISGIAATTSSDQQRMAVGFPLLDALYATLSRG